MRLCRSIGLNPFGTSGRLSDRHAGQHRHNDWSSPGTNQAELREARYRAYCQGTDLGRLTAPLACKCRADCLTPGKKGP